MLVLLRSPSKSKKAKIDIDEDHQDFCKAESDPKNKKLLINRFFKNQYREKLIFNQNKL